MNKTKEQIETDGKGAKKRDSRMFYFSCLHFEILLFYFLSGKSPTSDRSRKV